ncbi:MAG: hypothetical protein HGA45_40810 [Chloroflexales bacterium]|nr:hypothetical protein [Chloroflexales bacterium]
MTISTLARFGQRTATAWPLVAVGLGVVGLLGTAQALGELLYILECAGAVGGTAPTR